MGKAIYEQDIRHQVEDDHHGEIVAIDVDSGSWAVAEDLRVAVGRLREAQPEAVNILCERAGYMALRSFGAGSLRRADQMIEGMVDARYETVVALTLQGPPGM